MAAMHVRLDSVWVAAALSGRLCGQQRCPMAGYVDGCRETAAAATTATAAGLFSPDQQPAAPVGEEQQKSRLPSVSPPPATPTLSPRGLSHPARHPPHRRIHHVPQPTGRGDIPGRHPCRAPLLRRRQTHRQGQPVTGGAARRGGGPCAGGRDAGGRRSGRGGAIASCGGL